MKCDATTATTTRPREPEKLVSGSSLDGGVDLSLIRDEGLHEIFEATADCFADRMAVVTPTVSLSYGQLEARANQLANLLIAAGVAPGNVVAFSLPRGSAEVYVAMLAVLKCGAAYVPLDPEYPAERVACILDDVDAHLIITTRALADAQSTGDRATLLIDERAADLELQPSSRPAGVARRGDALCYVIYTSGSTGRPKGVEITHRSAAHLVRAEGRLFKMTPADRCFHASSVAFDASVEEIWLAFHAGAALVTADAQTLRDGSALARRINSERVTVLSCVPTMLAMLEGDVPSVRLLIVGGEACPPQLVSRWATPGRRMVNTYGPTEATVIATWADLAPGQPVTIGRPLPNYTAHVLDERRHLIAPGEVGELYVGGIGVARGYVNRPDLTAERFSIRNGERLYRTGDLVRLNDEGELEFCGRADGQVKLRGFRIELAEVESALLACAGVRAAAVTVRDVGALAAYCVPEAGAVVDEEAVKASLRRRLPAYMIPATIDVIERLPSQPSGKVDRTALPAPAVRRKAVGSDESMSPMERKAAGTWEGLFHVSPARGDDFFLDLGGHSLLAATAVSRLREDAEFADLSVADVYNHPTVEGLCAELLRRRSRTKVTAEARGVCTPSSLRHALCALAQVPCLYAILGLYAGQWLAPYLVYSWLLNGGESVMRSLVFAVIAALAVTPAMLVISIAAKWVLVGRYEPGRYPLWGWFYLRWWFAGVIQSMAPVGFLVGTPLLNLYLRLMGAKVGRGAHLATDGFAAYDCLRIGDGTTFNADASGMGYTVEDGWLKIGAVNVGRDCVIGARSVLGLNTTVEDRGRLGNLSLLPPGGRISAGQSWSGAPATLEAEAVRDVGKPWRQTARRATVAYLIASLLIPMAYFSAIFPGMVAMTHLDRRFESFWFLAAAPIAAASFVLLLCVMIVGVKWLLLGRVKAGTYSLHGSLCVRKWFVDGLMDLSLDVMGPLYATLYLAPWFRCLGAKLGRNAEISTACDASPDLLSIGDESFVADAVLLGAAHVEHGRVTIRETHIGRRAFVGNSALVPAGATVGDGALVGVLSTTPAAGTDEAGASWLGSPAVRLPQRAASQSFAEETTFKPTRVLYAQRYAIEAARILLPTTGFVVLTTLLLHGVQLLREAGLRPMLIAAIFPALYLVAGLAACGFVVAAKWVLVGVYRAGARPLWSTFVWRTELITAMHENLADPFLLDLLHGTPWLAWFFRAMGSRIGRRVFMNTSCLTEFDLIRVGDDAALNLEATLQTHLFEDRVMKMSTIDVGDRCNVGAQAVVLYDTTMEAGSSLGELSLLMKGESLPAGTAWHGTPARRTTSD